MQHRLILATFVVLSGCAANPQPIDTATGQPLELHWSCPKEGTVVYYQTAYAGTGKTDKTRWLGADEDNPDVCLKADGSRWLFARWNLAHLMLTADESKQLRVSMSDFLHGKSDNARFITRSINHMDTSGLASGNEQLIYFYRLAGLDGINVDGHDTKAIKLHVNEIYSGSTAQFSNDSWLDYNNNNILLKVENLSPGSHGNSSYQVTHIDAPITIRPELLAAYAGTYRNKTTGAVMVVKGERDHLVSTQPPAKSQPEYPYTDHDFYFLNYRGQTDSFVIGPTGLATQIIHRDIGKPDEVLDRVNADIAEN